MTSHTSIYSFKGQITAQGPESTNQKLLPNKLHFYIFKLKLSDVHKPALIDPRVSQCE